MKGDSTVTDIVLPRLGWTMEQGVFMGWLKRDGESVKAGEPLFSVEGDKAVQEIESIAGGVVRIAADGPKEGDTVPVGTVIGRIEAPGRAPPPAPASTPAPSPASPSVRRLARELGVELTPEAGGGAGGRIREEDVRALHARKAVAAESPHRQTATPRARRAARERGLDVADATGTGRNGRIRERDIAALSRPIAAPKPPDAGPGRRPSALREIIAQRLVHSLRTTAPVTLTATVDAENLVNLRGQFKAVAAGEAVPSFNDFFIKLTALALRKHPQLNARWQDDGIATPTDIHIGFAVDTPAGLLVPVIRDAAGLPLRRLAERTAALVQKAQARTLTADEMGGGTFTVTNLGAFGIDAFTPIINWPECAILGIGEIRKRPTVVGDLIVARHAVTLSLTFDHRIADGAPAEALAAPDVRRYVTGTLR